MLFDANGSSLAKGSYSVPSFTGTVAVTLRHMPRKFPPDALESGDVIITNGPWLDTGHLFNINVMRPLFRGSQLFIYTMSITHLPDIKGRGISENAISLYEERLRLLNCTLSTVGKLNEELLELIRANV